MNRNTVWIVLAAMTMMTACGDGTSGMLGNDAGTPIYTDAGTVRDVVSPTDTGIQPRDTGTNPRDSGTTPRDAMVADMGTPVEVCHPTAANFNCIGAQSCECVEVPSDILPTPCRASTSAMDVCRSLIRCSPIMPQTRPTSFINHCSPLLPPSPPTGATFEAFDQASISQLCDHAWIAETGACNGPNCWGNAPFSNGLLPLEWSGTNAVSRFGVGVIVRFSDERRVRRIYVYNDFTTTMVGVPFSTIDLDTTGLVATRNSYAAETDPRTLTDSTPTTSTEVFGWINRCDRR